MLIALAWQEVFTRTAHVSLRWQERALLGISVWIVYLLDHLLDASRQPDAMTSSVMALSCNAPRHHFTKKHRVLLLSMITMALLIDLLLATTLSRAVFFAGATLGLLTFFYLLLNAYLMSHGTWLRGREFIIATIFSFGCALIPLVRATAPLNLLPWVAVFAILGMINCILIARMERGVSLSSLSQNLIPSPRWLLPLLIVVAFSASNYYSIPSVALALFMSFCGLLLIPMIAKRYGYEAASLATDGALFLGALLALTK